MEPNEYCDSASPALLFLGFGPSLLLVFLVGASRLAKIRLLCSWGLASEETREVQAGGVVFLLSKKKACCVRPKQPSCEAHYTGSVQPTSKFHLQETDSKLSPSKLPGQVILLAGGVGSSDLWDQSRRSRSEGRGGGHCSSTGCIQMGFGKNLIQAWHYCLLVPVSFCDDTGPSFQVHLNISKLSPI